MKKATLSIVALVFCLSVAGTVVVQAQEDMLQPYTTKDINYHMKKTYKELKKMQELEKKLVAAGQQSSNSARNSVINDIQDLMGQCILRREDELGQAHTIQMHGGHAVSGTTDAADVGAPVGASNSNSALNYVEGIAGYRLRQLSVMQSLFVAAAQSMQPAIEKQSDALDRYTKYTRRFREELERAYDFMVAELEKRDWNQEEKAAEEEEDNSDH